MSDPDAATMPVSHAELETALVEGRVGVHASDLHGSLAGYLCGGGNAGAQQVLEALQLEIGRGPTQQGVEARLQEAYQDCRMSLDDPEMSFEPLLPDTGNALSDRAEALVEWCRGFLGGFGLAGAQRSDGLSADGNEILRDFGTIAGSQLAFADEDDDEQSLMEVSEFVRVGALLLHAETVTRRSTGAHAGGFGKRVH